jgi:hypothetical protein
MTPIIACQATVVMTSQVKRMYVKTMRGAHAVSRLAARVVTVFQAQLATTTTVFA